jgi:hypothetical protein
MQDTGAAVTNDAAKAKGMTACSAAKPLAEQLVLLEGWVEGSAARTVSAGVIFCGKE